MIRKYTMCCKSANHLMDMVYEDNIPLNITVGELYETSKGNKLLDLLLEYDRKDEKIINELIFNVLPIAELV